MLSDLVSESVDNPDITAVLYGNLLNGGLKIHLSNVEYSTDKLVGIWKGVCRRYGYAAEVIHSDGQVVLICTQLSYNYLNYVILLLVSMLVFNLLWS
jgi:hypothetical protein